MQGHEAGGVAQRLLRGLGIQTQNAHMDLSGGLHTDGDGEES